MDLKRRIIDKRVKEKFMMDDAYLNGYAKLCGWKATLVYLSLCRHTDKNQHCFPSEKLIAREFSISTKSVARGIKDLKKWNIIDVRKEIRENGTWKNNSYILLDKSVWKPKPNYKEITNSQETQSRSLKDCEGVDHETEGAIKETHEQGNTSKEIFNGNASVAGVKEIMNIFYEINPTLNWKSKTIRSACEELIEKFGLEETRAMTKQVIAIQGNPYAPTVTTPWELKEKLAKIKAYFDRQKNNKPKIARIPNF